MEGLLLVDKPAGWTSFDVVKKVRSIVAKASAVPYKSVKIGHSGTLDPFATGLLILLIGKKYTTLSEALLKQDKTYVAEMEFGKTSTTGDPEGEIIPSNTANIRPDKAELLKTLDKFRGEINQTPPVYSAIKVNGIRAYKLARQNKTVELKQRIVKVYELKLNSYDYPNAEIFTSVSSGAYIRSLVEDIGKSVKVGAYTKNLRRLSINKYSIDDAYKLDQINEQTISSMLLTIE